MYKSEIKGKRVESENLNWQSEVKGIDESKGFGTSTEMLKAIPEKEESEGYGSTPYKEMRKNAVT